MEETSDNKQPPPSPTNNTLKHSNLIKPVPKPVPSALRQIQPLHNLVLEKYDTAAH